MKWNKQFIYPKSVRSIIDEERPLEIKASEFIGRDIRHPLFSLMKWYFKSKGAVCLGTGKALEYLDQFKKGRSIVTARG